MRCTSNVLPGACALALLCGGLCGGLCGRSSPAWSEPYRLRSNVFADSHARAPAGLLTLDADSAVRPWLSAEVVVWVGAGRQSEADAMVISVHMRDPAGRAEARLGRFLVVPGAVRPIHLDGAHGRVRTYGDMSVEVFGGVPVQPAFSAHAYDWALGGRISRAMGDWGAAGIAYLTRRVQGRLDDEEIGLDAAFAASRSRDLALDLGARAAYDLIYPGVSDAQISASLRRRDLRLELFAGHRSAARILPATSLFSVLGDVPARHAGTRVTWKLAPRLDLLGSAAVRVLDHGEDSEDGDVGMELWARGLLRLDDRGKGALTLELRRDASPGAAWTGGRAATRLPMSMFMPMALMDRLSLAAELELVVPDDAGERGRVWPWALVAASVRLAPGWMAAAAVEASASPEHVYRLDGIVRLSHSLESR